MLHVLRNLERCNYQVSVHAFPLAGSRGTANMLKMAEREGIKTKVHRVGGGDEK